MWHNLFVLSEELRSIVSTPKLLDLRSTSNGSTQVTQECRLFLKIYNNPHPFSRIILQYTRSYVDRFGVMGFCLLDFSAEFISRFILDSNLVVGPQLNSGVPHRGLPNPLSNGSSSVALDMPASQISSVLQSLNTLFLRELHKCSRKLDISKDIRAISDMIAAFLMSDPSRGFPQANASFCMDVTSALTSSIAILQAVIGRPKSFVRILPIVSPLDRCCSVELFEGVALSRFTISIPRKKIGTSRSSDFSLLGVSCVVYKCSLDFGNDVGLMKEEALGSNASLTRVRDFLLRASSSIHLLVCQKGVSLSIKAVCESSGIVILERLSLLHIDWVCDAAGCQPLMDAAILPSEVNVGTLESVEVCSDGSLLKLRAGTRASVGGDKPRAVATLLARATDELASTDFESRVQDLLTYAANLIMSPNIIVPSMCVVSSVAAAVSVFTIGLESMPLRLRAKCARYSSLLTRVFESCCARWFPSQFAVQFDTLAEMFTSFVELVCTIISSDGILFDNS
eukprot:ANDGO_00162.mRNA.1 hypothetical protein